MSIYGQFCPISKAAEVLGERWTLLLVRELLLGSKRFNELQRGLTKMSPSLLTKRLKELEEANLLARIKISGQKGYEYHLTSSGRELFPLIIEMAKWGMKWVQDNIAEDELDIELLMLDIQRSLKIDKLPGKKVIVKFHITDTTELSDWWVIVDNKNVDLCTDSPGDDADLYITGDAQSLIQTWMGDMDWRQAQKSNKVKVMGSEFLKKEMQNWLGASSLSEYNPKMMNA